MAEIATIAEQETPGDTTIGINNHIQCGPLRRNSGEPRSTPIERAIQKVQPRVTAVETRLEQDGWTTITTPSTQATLTIRGGDTSRLEITHQAQADQESAIKAALSPGPILTTATQKDRSESWFLEVVLLLNPGTESIILLPTLFDSAQTAVLTSHDSTTATLCSTISTRGSHSLASVKHQNPKAVLPQKANDSPKNTPEHSEY